MGYTQVQCSILKYDKAQKSKDKEEKKKGFYDFKIHYEGWEDSIILHISCMLLESVFCLVVVFEPSVSLVMFIKKDPA